MKGQVFFHPYETHRRTQENTTSDGVGATVPTCPICGLIPSQKPNDPDGICDRCLAALKADRPCPQSR